MSDGRPSSLLLLFALTFTVLKAAWFTVLKATGTQTDKKLVRLRHRERERERKKDSV